MSLAPVKTTPRPPRTLHERLAGRAASIRGRVHGCVGDRPYRVFVVVSEWSEGEEGRGQSVEVSRVELGCGPGCDGRVTPPRVTLSGGWSKAMNGLVEDGMAMIEELDPTYTEADIVNFGRVTPDQDTSVEIIQDGRDGHAPDRPIRKYDIDGVPFRDPRRFGWVIRLASQEASAPFANRQLTPSGRLP